MSGYAAMVNSWQMYAICGGILLFLVIMCIVMLRKSLALGRGLGIDSAVLRKLIIASASFSFLPAFSILIGMIALSGTLGVPMAWMRLSVIGSLQYELQVTDISLQSLGYNGMADIAAITPSDFGAIALVMALGISGGLVCSIFFLGSYMKRLGRKKPEPETAPAADSDGPANASDGTPGKKKGFAAYASVCMFVGLCAAYFGSFIGDAARNRSWLPLIIACISGVCMLAFDYASKRKGLAWLENFSLAASMLIGMAAAVLLS